MEATGRKRRKFLLSLILGLGGLGLLARFFRPRLPQTPARLDVPRQEVPPHGALVYRQARVALVREEEDFYALDLTCTHLGCTVTVTPTELVCPCHGSRFDRQGAVLQGPAERPLRRLEVRIEGERWVVTG